MDRKVRLVDTLPSLPSLPKLHKNLGVYCRVSSNSHEQLSSLAQQVSHYVQIFRPPCHYLLYDIYIDVCSGSKADQRTQYQRIEIQTALAKYIENRTDDTALIVNSRISSYLMDLNFMAEYMQQLLDYLGYDDTVRETFLKIYKEKYPSSQETEYEFDSPENLKQIKEAMDEAKKTVRKQRMKDFWIK